MKGNSKSSSSNSLILLRAQNKDISTASLTLLTKVKLHLRRQLTIAVHRFKWQIVYVVKTVIIVISSVYTLTYQPSLWSVKFWVLRCPLNGGLIVVLRPRKSAPLPWIKVPIQQSLHASWKSLKIAVSAGKSLNFNANFVVWVELQRERRKHRKTFGIKLLML